MIFQDGQPVQTQQDDSQLNQSLGQKFVYAANQLQPEQQVMQDLQNRAAAISPPTQPGQLSQDNPYASMVADYSARVKQSSPDSTPKHGVKGFLSNFFQGAGDAMLTRVGMPTPYQQRQTDLQNFERISQIASQWESQLQVLNGVSLTRGHGYRGWMHFRLKSVNQADIKRVRLDIWLLDQLDRKHKVEYRHNQDNWDHNFAIMQKP